MLRRREVLILPRSQEGPAIVVVHRTTMTMTTPQKAYLLRAAGQTPEARDLSRGADISRDN